MIHLFYYNFPAFRLGIIENSSAILRIFFVTDNSGASFADQSIPISETPLLKQTAQEVSEYFSGKQQSFSVPLAPKGTSFQQSVQNSLLKIPYGETRTYGQIAELISNPTACCAIGNANHHNPIAILIPCQRVIGANRTCIGYARGLCMKKYLLTLEQSNKN